ncbi:MAG: hypothetical protein AAGJ18_05450 [Bacteroidota bacterium]
MKNNYNFKINPKSPDQEAINKHKDFAALMDRVGAVPEPAAKVASLRIKPLWAWSASMAALFLVGMIFLSRFNQTTLDSQTTTLAYLETQPYVYPPLNNFAKKAEVIKVNANQGGTYKFASGSKMVVPKAAFANSYGVLIDGEVEVHFKEYHDYVDFFLSGIPMEIKVDGQNQVLESAGMIEVYATQNGERLQMLPDKPFEIELKSKIAFAGETPPEFNIYFLDENKREWDLRGTDEIEVVKDNANFFVKVIGDPGDPNFVGEVTYDTTWNETLVTLEQGLINENQRLDQKLEKEIAKVTQQIALPQKPIEPEEYDGNSMTMELDFQTESLGAKTYKGTIWQVLTAVEKFEQVTSTVWDEYDLTQQSDDAYTLNLGKGDKNAKLNVKPVLVGNDYENAKQEFEQQMTRYEQAKAARQAQITAKKREIEERMALEKANINKSFQERIATLKAKGHDNYATNEILKHTIINKFRIDRFGIWNCDRPRPAYLAVLKGTFIDQHFEKYQQTMVYQTDKSQNTVRRFYLNDIADVQFNDQSDNLLWLVTKENKLAVFYPNDFERIQQKDGDYAFDLTLQNRTIESEADVREILQL